MYALTRLQRDVTGVGTRENQRSNSFIMLEQVVTPSRLNELNYGVARDSSSILLDTSSTGSPLGARCGQHKPPLLLSFVCLLCFVEAVKLMYFTTVDIKHKNGLMSVCLLPINKICGSWDMLVQKHAVLYCLAAIEKTLR